jgi:cell division protein ZapB
MPKTSPRIKNIETSSMADSSHIEQVTERVERLLLRYDELNRTNALLAEQLQAVSLERDSLKSRLSAARSRVEALLERLPEPAERHGDHTSAEQRSAP